MKSIICCNKNKKRKEAYIYQTIVALFGIMLICHVFLFINALIYIYVYILYIYIYIFSSDCLSIALFFGSLDRVFSFFPSFLLITIQSNSSQTIGSMSNSKASSNSKKISIQTPLLLYFPILLMPSCIPHFS